ncbi:hypothetical protein HMPREF1579_00713 [Gardnerella vaginalis JCP8066]|nr:hypothetical protein HMPREF1582_00786 [Gardnerella vaginalis JCP8151A]EPI59828.1 hypothetical protein HMPREF1579_00713 [Gardnerella vaginalis JCP8066]
MISGVHNHSYWLYVIFAAQQLFYLFCLPFARVLLLIYTIARRV